MKIQVSQYCIDAGPDVEAKVPLAVSAYSCWEGQMVCASEGSDHHCSSDCKQEMYIHTYICVCARISFWSKNCHHELKPQVIVTL